MMSLTLRYAKNRKRPQQPDMTAAGAGPNRVDAFSGRPEADLPIGAKPVGWNGRSIER